MTTIEEYMIRRKDLAPVFIMESQFISGQSIFLYAAKIDNRFSSAWSTSIELAIDSLTAVLVAAGEIE